MADAMPKTTTPHIQNMAKVRSAPVVDLPGDHNSLVSATIPAAICTESGNARVGMVVDGITTYGPPLFAITISVQ